MIRRLFDIKCVLSVKESNFILKKSKFSHLLTVKAEVADPPPYGQPDLKISAFFLRPALVLPKTFQKIVIPYNGKTLKRKMLQRTLKHNILAIPNENAFQRRVLNS